MYLRFCCCVHGLSFFSCESLLSYGVRPLPPAPDHCSSLQDCRLLALLQADLGILGTQNGFGMLGGSTLAPCRTLGRSWDTREHNKGHFCYPDLSFGMLGGLTLASWWSLGRSWDTTKDSLGSMPGFLSISGGFRDPILKTFQVFWIKTGVCSCLSPIFFSGDFWVRIWMSRIGKSSIWQGMYCKNQLSQKLDFS